MPDNNQPDNVNNQTTVNTSLADRHLAYAFAIGNPDSVKEALEKRSKLTTALLTSLINTGKQAFLAKVIQLKLIPIEEAIALNLIDLIESADTDMTDILIELIKAKFMSLDELLSLAIRKNNKDIVVKVIQANPTEDTLEWVICALNYYKLPNLIENVDTPENIVANAIQGGARPTPDTLDWARATDNPEIVRMVVDLGAKPTENTLDWAIWDSSEENEDDIVSEVIRAGAKLTKDTLYYALKYGNQKTIEKILELTAPVIKDMLLDAVLKNDIDRVVNAIKLGASAGEELLNLAIRLEKKESIVVALIGAGATATTQTLNYALKKGNKNIIAKVMALNPPVTQETLLEAVLLNDSNIVAKVIELGVTPTKHSLDWAINSGSHESVKAELSKAIKPGENSIKDITTKTQILSVAEIVVRKGIFYHLPEQKFAELNCQRTRLGKNL